jgi:hypothetical protein
MPARGGEAAPENPVRIASGGLRGGSPRRARYSGQVDPTADDGRRERGGEDAGGRRHSGLERERIC